MKLRRLWLTTALLALLASTTGAIAPAAAAAKPTTTNATTVAAPQAIAPKVPNGSAPPGSASWTSFHHDRARSGYDSNEGLFSSMGLGWTNSNLIGDIYAEPLVYKTTVYIVTEDNYLYALQDTTGAVLWSRHFATPMNSSSLPCGNITPHVGITGTPVIDTSLNRIYTVGMVSSGHYWLWGVDLSSHSLLVNHLVDPANLDITKAQGQRGALGLSQGLVYIPYGGRAGDCFSPLNHTYYGIVLGARETDGVVLYKFQTNGTGSVWAAGGESIDSTGHVYVAIGNGSAPDSERVFKLNPNLSRQNSWVPANQSSLDSADADVGSIIPQLVGGGDVFQNGKTGDGYLLGSSLAQQQGPTHVCTGVTSDASFGAAAYWAPYIYVPCSNGLYVMQQTGNTFAEAWHYTTGSPDVSSPIVAGGNVIFIDHSLDTLVVLNATTGAPVASAQLGSTTHFGTPATGNGFVFAADIGAVHAFQLLGCTSANMSPDKASPQAVGTTVTFTATSTGCVAAPEYRFVLDGTPVGTTWGTATWAWNTSGLRPGVHGVGVWVRSTGSLAGYESWWLGTYTVTLPTCTSADASTLALSPVTQGAPVPWTGSALGCTNPEFRFFVLPPGGAWTLKREYGIASWTWDTTGLPSGTYQIGVWARQIGSGNAYDAYNYVTMVLGAFGTCVAKIGPQQTSPQAPGTNISVFGSSTNCTTPSYEFLLLPPGGVWTVKQPFGAGTWLWMTAGLPAGTYELGVWVKQAGSTRRYDAYALTVFTLKVPGTCTSATLTPSAASPQTPGTSITWTATSTGCSAARYEIWELIPPSATWVSKGPYTAGTTYTWNTTNLSGPYRWGVWARQNGSTRSYDTYAQTTFWVGT
jgi:hypothetical protein